MVSVMNGTKLASIIVVFSMTSNKIFKEILASLSPNYPFNLFLLNLMYQFMRLSKNFSKSGTTV